MAKTSTERQNPPAGAPTQRTVATPAVPGLVADSPWTPETGSSPNENVIRSTVPPPPYPDPTSGEGMRAFRAAERASLVAYERQTGPGEAANPADSGTFVVRDTA